MKLLDLSINFDYLRLVTLLVSMLFTTSIPPDSGYLILNQIAKLINIEIHASIFNRNCEKSLNKCIHIRISIKL